jgi:hypothetical protein
MVSYEPISKKNPHSSGLLAWLKWHSTCLIAQGSESNLNTAKKKKTLKFIRIIGNISSDPISDVIKALVWIFFQDVIIALWLSL